MNGVTHIFFPWYAIASCWLLFFRATHLAGKQHALSFISCRNLCETSACLTWHIRGLLFLGIIPYIWWFTGLQTSSDTTTLFRPGRDTWWVYLIALAAGFTGYRQARKVKEEPIQDFQPAYLTAYIPIRVLYIISYELFFRGILLFETLKVASPFAAIVINTLVYFLSHIYGGWKELMGTLLLGPLLCLSSISSGSVTGAILIHLTLTFSYELPVLTHIPYTSKRTI